MVPAATICPAALTFAGVSPCFSMLASTSSSAPPSTAVIPVSVTAAALAIARPRIPISRIASAGLITDAIAPAASSPTLCPATPPAFSGAAESPPNSSSAAETAAATSSGCATAVSLISSAPAVVPARIRSHPASSDQAPRRSAQPGSSSQADRNPGAWAPWPGAVISSITQACTVGVRYTNDEPHELLRRSAVRNLQFTCPCPLAARRRWPSRARTRPGRWSAAGQSAHRPGASGNAPCSGGRTASVRCRSASCPAPGRW